jgi:RHS repeat-associated protein
VTFGFQYFNDDLKFFTTSEGYVSAIKTGPTDYKFRYVYNYTDHLGNIRLSYGLNENETLKILEENHYYPFGLKHNNYNSVVLAHRKEDPTEQIVLRGPIVDPGGKVEKNYAYKFNGQEWQDELGLNLYDMEMRDYDPAIGRWTGIDPVTHYDQSPYNAFDSNPVLFADPSGADGIGGEHFTSVFGMQVSTPTNTGMYTGMSDNGMPIPFGTGVGAAWGDGGLLPNTMDILDAAYKMSSSDATFVMGKNGWATYWSWKKDAYETEMYALHINFRKSYDRENASHIGKMLPNFRTNIGPDVFKFKGLHYGVPEFESSLMAGHGAITPGPFSLYAPNLSNNPSFSTHEPGHVLQFVLLGPIHYYILIGIPSMATAKWDNATDVYTEKTANQLWYWFTGETHESNHK